jgi:hypothetical protein
LEGLADLPEEKRGARSDRCWAPFSEIACTDVLRAAVRTRTLGERAEDLVARCA